MTRLLACLVLASVVSACGDVQTPNQLAPSPLPPVAQIASTITLTSVAGMGATAGTVYVVAMVRDAAGKGVGAAVVHFATTAGTMRPDTVTADGGGQAQTTVTTTALSTVTATAGAATGAIDVTPTAAPTPPTPAPVPPPTPPGPPAPGPLTVTIFVTPAAAGSSTTFGLASPALLQAVWTFGDGSALTTTTAAASHVYASAGLFTAGVTVTDTIGRTASASLPVTIAAAPPPPAPPVPFLAAIASCTVGTKSLSTGQTPVSCNAAATFNGVTVASTALSVTWDFGDGTTDAGVIVTHNYTQAGTFLIVAHVTAASGDGFASKSVVVPSS